MNLRDFVYVTCYISLLSHCFIVAYVEYNLSFTNTRTTRRRVVDRAIVTLKNCEVVCDQL